MSKPQKPKSKKVSIFRTPANEAEYHQAYAAALKLWPVPYEQCYISTRFGDTHVVMSGPKDASPLVLFHGTGGGATIWYRNVEALSQQHRVYAVDTITEANESIPTRSIKNRREFTDWITDLFDGLEIGRADLVGNSFGGFLALNTAYYFPELVRKAVLLSPAATFDPMWALWLRLLIPAHVIAPLVGSKSMVARAYAWLWQDFPVDDCIARLRSLTSLYGTPRHCPPSVFREQELRQIHTPVLLLIGDNEVIYSPERVVRRAKRLICGLEAEIIPGANHCTQYTAAQVVNQKILKFLA